MELWCNTDQYGKKCIKTPSCISWSTYHRPFLIIFHTALDQMLSPIPLTLSNEEQIHPLTGPQPSRMASTVYHDVFLRNWWGSQKFRNTRWTSCSLEEVTMDFESTIPVFKDQQVSSQVSPRQYNTPITAYLSMMERGITSPHLIVNFLGSGERVTYLS